MKTKITQIVIAFCLLFVTGITTSCSNDDSANDPNNSSNDISGTWIIKFNDGETNDILFKFENGGVKFLGQHIHMNENVTLNTYTLKNNQLNILHNREYNHDTCNDVKVKEFTKINADYDNSISKFKGFLTFVIKGGSSGNCTIQNHYEIKGITIEKKQQ